jgi:hypothetical protein
MCRLDQQHLTLLLAQPADADQPRDRRNGRQVAGVERGIEPAVDDLILDHDSNPAQRKSCSARTS